MKQANNRIFGENPRLTEVFVRQRGFSLVECVIALLILMIASLAIILVLNYAFRNNESARKRMAALLLAEQHLEELRNTRFGDLTAGTMTYANAVSDGVRFKLVRTITDSDLLVNNLAAGPEEKVITITVSPLTSSIPGETIILTTIRANNRPGPNREENVPD